MSKRLVKICSLIAISILLLAACSSTDADIKGIKSIELKFKPDNDDSYSCTLSEKDNLKEAMKLYKSLETYKAPNDSKKHEEVSFSISYDNGETKDRVYVKVSPVAKLFENIFKSKEVIKQWTNN